MTDTNPKLTWQSLSLKPRFPWNKEAIRPADVGDGLCRAMLARENALEDAAYHKIVPNRFVVELSRENYLRNYHPIESSILGQWRTRLLESLLTANSRQGRKEYRLEGQLEISLRPVKEFHENQARILCRVERSVAKPTDMLAANRLGAVAYLEEYPTGRRWPLYQGKTSIGRDITCDIYLDTPAVQEKRLVSGQHAFIHCDDQGCVLYDGSQSGKPSANGTYVNMQPVPSGGQLLRHSDLIVLAALNPQHPRPDIPGIASFRFLMAEED